MNTDDLTLIEGHNSSRHDGGVAVWRRGKIYALAAERVDRIKHSENSAAAYHYMITRLGRQLDKRKVVDHFSPQYTPVQVIHHHLAHAASAFYPSPFKEAAVLVVDGMGPLTAGEFASTSLWVGKGNDLHPVTIVSDEYPCYRSLGHFYSGITWYLGFNFFDVCHTMALSKYARPHNLHRAMQSLVWADRSPRLFDTDHDFIRFILYERFGDSFPNAPNASWMDQRRRKYESLLGPVRRPDAPLTFAHCEIAAAAQAQLEALLQHLFDFAYETTGAPYLCYSGGVALNCVANGTLFPRSHFKRVFVQPASDDSGQALGKLLYRFHSDFGMEKRWTMDTASLGPEYTTREIRDALRRLDHSFKVSLLPRARMATKVSRILATGHPVAWFHGRSEFGPRALGSRSLLGDPRSIGITSEISARCKPREWYRPFAPSTLATSLPHVGSSGQPDPFMTRTVRLKERIRRMAAAVTAVDRKSVV